MKVTQSPDRFEFLAQISLREPTSNSGVLIEDRGWQAVVRAMSKVEYNPHKTGF